MLTYNSGDTIRQALDSVLLQQRSFPIEVIVGDDASSDNTCDILREYAQRYPEEIRLMLAQKNRGVQANYFDCLEAASGEYIADCAGDDFWTQNDRLQKMVDILDHAPQAAMVFSDWTTLSPDGTMKLCRPVYTSDVGARCMTPLILAAGGVQAMHLSAAIYRKSALWPDYMRYKDTIFRNTDFGSEDLSVLVFLTASSPLKYLNEPTLVYRVGGDSSITSEADSAKSARFSLASLRLRLRLAEELKMKDDRMIRDEIARLYDFALVCAFRSRNPELKTEVLAMWPEIPRKLIKTYLRRMFF